VPKFRRNKKIAANKNSFGRLYLSLLVKQTSASFSASPRINTYPLD